MRRHKSFNCFNITHTPHSATSHQDWAWEGVGEGAEHTVQSADITPYSPLGAPLASLHPLAVTIDLQQVPSWHWPSWAAKELSLSWAELSWVFGRQTNKQANRQGKHTHTHRRTHAHSHAHKVSTQSEPNKWPSYEKSSHIQPDGQSTKVKQQPTHTHTHMYA